MPVQAHKRREQYELNNQDFCAYKGSLANFSSASLQDGNVNGSIFLVRGNHDLGEPFWFLFITWARGQVEHLVN